MLAGQATVINGDGKYIRDYVFVKDVAKANILAMTRDGEDFCEYNVGTGVGTDVNELEKALRDKLSQVIERKGIKLNAPAALYGSHRPGDLRSSLLDYGSIESKLGWRPTVSIEEGLLKTAEWFA